MSKVWWTSDTHFGHAAIIGYCRRPFANVRDMDEAMIANWNAVVRHDNVIWHVGDFAHGADAKHVRSVFHRLNGIKRLVIGNHDRQDVLDLPWAAKPTHLASVGIEGMRVIMCHYGLRVWPGMRRKAVALYGHSHGRLPGTSMSLERRRRLLGLYTGDARRHPATHADPARSVRPRGRSRRRRRRRGMRGERRAANA